MRMSSITVFAAGAFLLTGAALRAQAPDNVIFTASGGPAGAVGAMAVPGPQTFAIVAGELRGNTVKGAPYSAQAVTQTTRTLADGNQIVNNTSASVYRDMEGRERREQSLPNIGNLAAQEPQSQMIFISDPVAGVNYSLNPNTHIAFKMPVPQGPANTTMVQRIEHSTANLPMPGLAQTSGLAQTFVYRTTSNAANPPVVEQLGTQSIEGVLATGTRTTVTIPAGQIGNTLPIQIVDEVWRSPDLQVNVQSTHSDPRMGTTTYTLSNITRADPSPALFQVPADYTINDAPAMNMQKSAAPTAQ